jgi:hypothetical protein
MTWEPCSGIWKSRQTKERKLFLLLAGSCSQEKRKYLTFDALKKSQILTPPSAPLSVAK